MATNSKFPMFILIGLTTLSTQRLCKLEKVNVQQFHKKTVISDNFNKTKYFGLLEQRIAQYGK